GEADAVDGDRVAEAHVGGDERTADGQARLACLDDFAEFLDDSREHRVDPLPLLRGAREGGVEGNARRVRAWTAGAPRRVCSHPDSDRRSWILTRSTVRWMRTGRGLAALGRSPPARNFTDPADARCYSELCHGAAEGSLFRESCLNHARSGCAVRGGREPLAVVDPEDGSAPGARGLARGEGDVGAGVGFGDALEGGG